MKITTLALATVLAGALLPAASAEARTTPGIILCNHGGYAFDVYADGPDSFSDDLAGSFDECADWRPATPGRYEIGVSFYNPGSAPVRFQVRIKRAGTTTYRAFSDEGTFSTNVGRNAVTRIDLFIR